MTYRGKAGFVLFAKDLDAVARFYRDLLGLEAVETEDTHVLLEGPLVQIVVHAVPAHIAAQIEISIPPQRRTDTAIKLVFEVASIRETRPAIAAMGGELDPESSEWTFKHHRVCDGHDPEGNVIQLRERIG